jgi:hypothetical protein
VAGLIAALKLRRREPDPYDPHLAGRGGYTDGPGRTGEAGFPGSTSATRVNNGKPPRAVKIKSDSNVGFDQGFEGDQARQAGRHYGEGWANPRETSYVSTPQPRTIASLRKGPGEWFGGLPLRSDAVAPADHVVGGNPLTGAAAAGGHSTYDTETPRTSRQPDISGGVPGSNNVRNSIALRYQAAPGQYRTYKSAPRADQGDAGPAESGAGGGRWASAPEVTVQSRFVWDQGGVQTWSVQRQMPYNGRGDGARGADLNGTRYYAEGPPVAVNAGQGSYGVSRLRGPNHRPVYFNEPSPWTSQFYDTTASVGTPDAPGPGGQAPNAVYTSPEVSRAGLTGTGR